MTCHLNSNVFSFQCVLLLQCLSIKLKVNHLKLLAFIWELLAFSHGQLYVACSKVGTGKNLYIFASGSETRNIVYHI
ncbi:hypothetical protein X975_23343, partial [Stegodyphus mimosarum]